MKVVYALSIKNNNLIEPQLIASAKTLKHFNPNCIIYIITTHDSHKMLQEKNSELLVLIKNWILVKKHHKKSLNESRMLKTKIRDLIKGKVLYLDADTIVCKSLSKLFSDKHEMSLVQDQMPSRPVDGFPSWLIPYYTKLKWSAPTKKYYNSGVMLINDNTNTRRIFRKWQNALKQTMHLGLYQDQPSLNYVLNTSKINICELDKKYNAMILANEKYRKNAFILHFFFSELGKNRNKKNQSEYLNIIKEINNGIILNARQILKRIHKWRVLGDTSKWQNYFYAYDVLGLIKKGINKIISYRRYD
jgi:lipopolysaccharide biosynthesis glycosyltransferase